MKLFLQRVIFLAALLLAPTGVHAQISYVAATCTGVTTCTFAGATINANDVLVGCAFRDGNNTAPTVPAGWTTIENSAGTQLNGAALAWKAAVGGGSDTSGSWTSATSLIIDVYRGAEFTAAIGGHAANGALSGTFNYPAITMTNTSGSSWVFACAGSRSTLLDFENSPPNSTTLRQNVTDGTDELATFDTNGGVASWASADIVVPGVNAAWRTQVAEILQVTTTTIPHLLSSTGVGQ